MNKKQANTSKASSAIKDKDKDKHVPSIKKQQQDASRRGAAASKRMQDLMRQFGTILRQAMHSICYYLFTYALVLECAICVNICFVGWFL